MVEIKDLAIVDGVSLLDLLADRLEKVRYRRDEMNREDAFSDAIAEVVDAIREVTKSQRSIRITIPSTK